MISAGVCCLVLQMYGLSFAEGPMEIEPYSVITGLNSGVGKRTFYRVDNEDNWKKVWEKRQTGPNVPMTIQFDFTDVTIVAIFDGVDSNRGILIRQVIDQGDRVVVRYYVENVSTIVGASIKRTKAYAFVVLPKITKKILIEEYSPDAKGDSGAWELRSTLETDENNKGVKKK